MNALMNFLENKLMPMMQKIAMQRHLSAVKDGLVATIPITVIGSIFLLIPNIPWPQSYVQWVAANPDFKANMYVPFNMSLSLLSVYAAFGIGKRLAEGYSLDGLSGGLSALFTFFSTLKFSSVEGTSYIATRFLGGEGMFTAILTAILAVEIMRLCVKNKIVIKLPDQVPPNVMNSFESLVPAAISVTIVWIIVHFLGFDINQVISMTVTPLLSMSANSIAAPLAYAILTSVMWLFGIHPGVLASIMLPVWTINADANMAAAAAGQLIPNIGVRPFIFTFLWIGGGGGTLALCCFMSMSKSKVLKSLGRLSIAPGLFNINEPILFGLPIVLNPYFAIPVIVAPIICTIVTYTAFSTGIVPGMGYPHAAVWTVPSILAGTLCTGSVKGSFLVLVNFIIYAVVYYPFFKVYEGKMLKEEAE